MKKSTIGTIYSPKEDGKSKIFENQFEKRKKKDKINLSLKDKIKKKILITNSISIKHATKLSKKFITNLINLIPDSIYYPRRKHSLQSIQNNAIKEDFIGLIIISEDHKIIHSLYHICLPKGPIAHYRVSNIKLYNFKANKFSKFKPEFIIKNFTTPLGKHIVGMLKTLFHTTSNFQDRQIITFYNEKDFIFFRRHRYKFKTQKEVLLQELGPRFTLRLKSLQSGLFNSSYREFEFYYSKSIDPRRKRNFL